MILSNKWILGILCCFLTTVCYGEEVCLTTKVLQTSLERKAAELLSTRLVERGFQPVSRQQDKTTAAIEFKKDTSLVEESYRIEMTNRCLTLSAKDGRGFIYGVGAVLTGLPYNGTFQYNGATGVFAPVMKMRGIYFATHFGNWYHNAPMKEVKRYIEDLALYGLNLLSVWYDFHHYTGIDDPNAEKMIARLHEILRYGNEVGLGGSLTMLANEAYSTSPKEIRAVPFPNHYKVEICPSCPGGMAKILEYRKTMLDRFSDLSIEYLWIWPYDQGGCHCEKCSPWGSNGFLKTAEEVAKLVREKMPKTKIVLSTWEFGYHFPNDIEWIGFYKKMEEHPSWVDAVMIEHHNNYPAFAVKNGAPGNYPVLNFPEISMRGMSPWGGYGANPQPRRLQSLWNVAGKIVSGGFPYSEGIYEDLNKYICAKLYWQPTRTVDSIVREYAERFFSKEYAKEITYAIYLLEQNMNHGVYFAALAESRNTELTNDGTSAPQVYRLNLSKKEEMKKAFDLLEQVQSRLPENVVSSWRWQVLYCRAGLDAELSRTGGRPTVLSEKYFKILSQIYHDQNVTPDVITFIQVPLVNR